jgi:hypothetical protein
MARGQKRSSVTAKGGGHGGNEIAGRAKCSPRATLRTHDHISLRAQQNRTEAARGGRAQRYYEQRNSSHDAQKAAV